MANANTPNGFQQYTGIGVTPSFEAVVMSIASNDTNAIFSGDPVVQLNTGYVTLATSQSTTIAGVFTGCRYLSISQKKVVWMPYWPGTADANGDVTAYIINDPHAQFIVQTANSNTTATPVGLAAVGSNIGFANAGITGGNTSSGLSGAYADQYTLATTSTLPFRVMALANYSPGAVSPLISINGNDNTTAYNRIIVTFNNAMLNQLTGI